MPKKKTVIPHKKKIKGDNYNYFIEGHYGHYKGEQKTREYKESDAYI